MTPMVCVLLAFILAIFLNWKYQINMGIVSICAAFFIGCFLLDTSPGTLKEFIPIKVIFPVVSITLFYGFALENGTLQKLVQRLLHNDKRKPTLLPILIFLICVCMGLLGIDAGSTVIIMAPISMTLTTLMGLDVVTVAAALLMGAPMGGNYMFGNGGNIIRALLEENMSMEQSLSTAATGFWDGTIVFTILFFLVFFVRLVRTKDRLVSESAVPKGLAPSQPFTPLQKKNLILIGAVVFFVAVSSILSVAFPGTPLTHFAKKMDIGFLALFGSLIASCMNLGDLNHILRKHVPWKILIMLSGISVLMGVAKACGLIEFLSNALSENVPVLLIPAAVVLIAGVMSLFSSAISVVIPTLFPMVPAIAASCGLPLGLIYSCIVLGASLTGTSPFSTGGALVIGSTPENKARDKLVYQQLLIAVICLIFGSAYMTLRSLFI